MDMGRLAFLFDYSKEGMVVPEKVAGVARIHCPPVERASVRTKTRA
jgi:hypothetical protein